MVELKGTTRESARMRNFRPILYSRQKLCHRATNPASWLHDWLQKKREVEWQARRMTVPVGILVYQLSECTCWLM